MIKINDEEYKSFQDFFNKTADLTLTALEWEQLADCMKVYNLALIADELKNLRKEVEDINNTMLNKGVRTVAM